MTYASNLLRLAEFLRLRLLPWQWVAELTEAGAICFLLNNKWLQLLCAVFQSLSSSHVASGESSDDQKSHRVTCGIRNVWSPM